MRALLLALAAIVLAWPAAGGAAELNIMVEAVVRGRRLEGLPLNINGPTVHLLARDGVLWDFAPAEAHDLRQTAPAFHPYSFGELRAALDRELGGRLQITSTSHYIVAHPSGLGAQWPERFETLYRSFVHYCAVRGQKIREPEFPLVALVFGSRQEFLSYASAQGTPVPGGVLGFYSPVTNRIMLYDSSDGAGGAWQQDASTIIHEATHQTAFNTGVHSRLAQPPRWLAEGLAMLFEARGVYDSRHYTSDTDRVNQNRLKQFRQYLAAGRRPQTFLQLIDSERMFDTQTGAAYAESWALVYFLSETQPRAFFQYLAKTAARPSFAPYSFAQRRADFTEAFGQDLKMLDANFLRFIEKIRS